jgi:hypothetical protein
VTVVAATASPASGTALPWSRKAHTLTPLTPTPSSATAPLPFTSSKTVPEMSEYATAVRALENSLVGP